MAAENGLIASAARAKIAFILDAFPDPQAGTEGQFWLLYNTIDRSRFEPRIMLLRPSGFLQERIPAGELTVLHVQRLRSPRSWWSMARAAYRIRRSGCRLAHIFFNDSALVFPVILKILGMRVIVARRDLGIWYTKGILRLLRFNRHFTDAVVANCEAVKDVVVAKEGVGPDRVAVIYNAITRAEQHQVGQVPNGMRLPKGARALVLVANLRPLKRIDVAVKALALLGSEHADVHLVVCGEDRPARSGGSQQVELQRLAESLGVGSRVHFCGKIADPMPIVWSAELCLQCSETEGLSNTIIEYMYAGKPIICTNVGGSSELVQDGWNGFLCAPGDAQQLASLVERLLSDRELAARFGAASRERAQQMFDVNSMMVGHMELYGRLLLGLAVRSVHK